MLYEILKSAKLGTEAAPDMFTGLIASKMPFAKGGGEIAELSGVPPLSFKANGEPLLDWRITGAAQGVGVRTENLLNYHYLFTPDYDRHSTFFDYYKLMLEPSTQYTFTTNATSTNDATTFLVGTANVMSTSNDGLFNGVAKTITSNPDGSIYIAKRIAKQQSLPILPESDFDNGVYYIMLNTGSTANPFEPYGYKISVVCGGSTTNIYIGDSPLYDGDTIGMTDTGIVIPTVRGNNVLTVDTTVQPSEVYIKYRR